jgi:hypothetical protein
VALIGLWTATAPVVSADEQPKGKALADDGAKAKDMNFDNVRDVRYAELWFISPDPKTDRLQGIVYNTTGLNNSADPKDTCPKALWDKVDPESLKKEYGVTVVFKNGPRYWCYDWFELPVGAERDFKVLDQELTIGAIKGVARVVQDDLENTYNACFEENGEKNYNYKP